MSGMWIIDPPDGLLGDDWDVPFPMKTWTDIFKAIALLDSSDYPKVCIILFNYDN